MLEQEQLSDGDEEIPQLVQATVSEKSLLTDELESNQEHERTKLLLRREARRKKILENAKDRLAKLNGREKPSPNGSAIYEEVSDPEVEPDIPQLLRADIPQVQTDWTNDTEFSSLNSLDFNTLLGGKSDETQINANQTTNQASFLQRTRLHVLLTALVSFVLTVAGVWGTGVSVFALIGICLISELLLFTRHKEVDPMVNLLILLCGIQPQMAKRVMNLFIILYTLFTDMGIFVFCFCALSIIYSLTHAGAAELLVIK